MYVRPISTRLFSGMLMPEMRAIACALPLPLLVTGVGADDQHAPVAADDLALLAHRLDRRSYLHDPFRLVPIDSALAAVPAAATTSRTSRAGRSQTAPSATMKSSKRAQARAGYSGGRAAAVLVPRRQHARAIGGDGDRELEVGGERAVLREDRPVVVGHPHLVTASCDHRLDRQHHPLLQPRASPGRPVVGDLRILVHLAPDAVPDERADDREALRLDVPLDRVRDVTEAIARHALRHRREQRLLGRLEQLLRDRRDRPDRERARGIRDPAVVHDADVDRQDVAALELVLARDAVHDHRVRRGADRAGEAAVALEGRDGALRADEALGRFVELLRRDAGTDLALDQLQRADEDVARGGHLVDLLGRLLDDHSVSSRRSVASTARTWSWTSVGERVPSMRRSEPRSS